MKKVVLASVLAALFLLPVAARADDESGTIRLRAGMASVSYSAPVTFTDTNGNTLGKAETKSSYPAVSAGLSYVSPGGFFIDLSARNSQSAKWKFSETPGEARNELKRDETTLTFGKSLGTSWAIFWGYQGTTMEQTFPVFVDESKGHLIFVGLSKRVGIGSASLGFSGALGGYAQAREGVDNSVGGGASLGTTLFVPFTSWLGLNADLRYQSYAVEHYDDQGNVAGTGQEKIGSGGLSLVLSF